jgi:hypothetical protein
MDYAMEKNYLYTYSYSLDSDEIKKMINKVIDKLIKTENLDKDEFKYNLKINIVKNKDDVKLGYSYLWINNLKLFNALIGLNLDGSERVIIEENEDEEESAELTTNWGDMVSEEKEVIKTILEPLIKFSKIAILEEERIRYNLPYSEFDFYLTPAKKLIEPGMKNMIFSNGVPPWLNEKKIRKFFEPFEKDNQLHSKKIDSKVVKFKYPLVKIRNTTVNINFSNFNPNTASFVINMTRKVKFFDEKENKHCLLFFKQKENKKN